MDNDNFLSRVFKSLDSVMLMIMSVGVIGILVILIIAVIIVILVIAFACFFTYALCHAFSSTSTSADTIYIHFIGAI